MTQFTNSLNFCYWNIGRLFTHNTNKAEDNLFIKKIENYDLVILAETHIGYNTNIVMNTFNYFPVCRNVSTNGGLAILRKNKLKNYIKILPNTCKDFQWIKFEKEYFQLESDVYLCAVYIPPANSSYTKHLSYDILELIEKDILKFKSKGEILICGDCNARTAINLDVINDDTSEYLPLFESYKLDNSTIKKQNHDTVLDTRGKELLDFCIGNQLRIVNGRCIGDLFGRFTCFNPLGQSTVDYLIASENIINQILYFKVSNFIPTLSDCHCKIVWEILANYPSVSTEIKELQEAPINYKWASESTLKFQSALNTPEIQTKINQFSNRCNDTCSVIDIADIVNDFENIVISAAEISLKRPKARSKKNKNKNKKWFDQDLQKLRSNLIAQGKLFSKYPKNPWVRGHYYKLYRVYNKLRKQKYRKFKNDIINKLDTLSVEDPKQYWNLVNDLRAEKASPGDNSVDPDTWVKHFKSLHSSVDKNFTNRLNQLENMLLQKEGLYNIFNPLDNKITQKEISSAIRTLKNGKAKGLDLISNEMLKSGQTQLLPCLSQLFNICFSFGHYPASWAKGYITPIYKSDDPSNPNNYRGITITSSLGKLFNGILNTRLDNFLNEHNLIHPSQVGFTKHARTSDHCFVIKCLIDKYCSIKEGRLYACFIDFRKAFDSVIHTGLKLKLLNCNVGTKFYKIINNMYMKGETCIKVSNFLSPTFPIKLGVRQGDNLRPTLFKIFINDLPSYLENSFDPVTLHLEKIDCLMYADDIVMFSGSPEGLQSKLKALEKYCDDWGLDVNIKKSKVIIFNKAGRIIRHKFLFKNSEIECVSNYKYLGIHFSASGSFSIVKQELYKKALKAFFKLKKDFLSLYPSIKTSIHVFDHTIKPILLYGSEIWGIFNVNNRKIKESNNIQLDQCFKNFKGETLHLKFCKYILGLNKKSVNHATLSELGRHPLHFDIIKSITKYCYRLENLSTEFPLLKDAYICSKELHLSNKTSWYSSIEKILNILNIQKKTFAYKKGTFNNILRKHMKIKYLTDWNQTNVSMKDGKLVTYLNIKTNFGLEKYLTLIKNYQYRRSICKLRVSSHRLLIEQGRYKNIPRNERLCKNCNQNAIEDESHFLIKCDKFNEERKDIFSQLNSKVQLQNLHQLSDEQKLFFILNCEDHEILNSVGKFLHEHMP